MTQRFWVKLTAPPDLGDAPYSGELEMSLQLVPKSVADRFPAGSGRGPPNQNPMMPEPTRPPGLRMIWLGLQAIWDEINAIVPVGKIIGCLLCCMCFSLLFFVITNYFLLGWAALGEAPRGAAWLQRGNDDDTGEGAVAPS